MWPGASPLLETDRLQGWETFTPTGRRASLGLGGAFLHTFILVAQFTCNVVNTGNSFNSRYTLNTAPAVGTVLCAMAFTTRKRSPDLDPRTSQQSLFLLDLPDELLLKIAGSIPDPEDLCQLSLACKKLKHVAQETLVKEVLLPPKGMPYLIRTLCDRPDLCGKITSVDLDDYQHTGSANLLESPDSRSRLETWSYFSRCRQLIGNDAFDKVGRYDLRDFTSPLLWSKEHRFFLAILVAACSNITELSLRLPPASQDRQLQVALGTYTQG